MNKKIQEEKQNIVSSFNPRSINSIVEPNRLNPIVYLLLGDNETDSVEIRRNEFLLPNAVVKKMPGTGDEIRRSAASYYITVPVDDAVQDVLLPLLSGWNVRRKRKEGKILDAKYGFADKAGVHTQIHLLWSESTVFEAHGDAGSSGVLEQTLQLSHNFVDHRNWRAAASHNSEQVFHYILALWQSQSSTAWKPRSGQRIIEAVRGISPAKMAEVLVQAYQFDERWLGTFAYCLYKQLPNTSLMKIMGTWKLTTQEAAAGFGVSCETLDEWIKEEVPVDSIKRLSEVCAATDLLVHYLKADRIPAVVRKPIERLGNRSLLDLYSNGETGQVLRECRNMFRFENVHG